MQFVKQTQVMCCLCLCVSRQTAENSYRDTRLRDQRTILDLQNELSLLRHQHHDAKGCTFIHCLLAAVYHDAKGCTSVHCLLAAVFTGS